MRKVVITLLAFVVTAVFSVNVFAAPVSSMVLNYDGTDHSYSGAVYALYIKGNLVENDVPPIEMNGIALIPVRAVFESLGASVDWDKVAQRMSVTLNDDSFVFINGNRFASIDRKPVGMDVPAKKINERLMIPLTFLKNLGNITYSIDQGQKTIRIDTSNTLKEIGYSPEKGRDLVSISLDRINNYNIMRVTGPERIVVDIPDTSVPDKLKKIDVSGKLVKSIRYSQYDRNTARVVLDVIGQPQFSAEAAQGSLNLVIENPTYKNMVYHNNGDRVYLTLNGAKLTTGGAKPQMLYTSRYDKTGNKYTISFPSKLADLSNGTININDSMLNTVTVGTDSGTGRTSITFDAKDKFVYEVVARPEMGDTNITVLKPKAKGQRLIVIDPGHGGFETGAVYGDLYEKDLNLDIACRLNNLLQDRNIKTYMIREDDSYVGLYERCFIANDLDATLFLSIHNNAIDDPGYGGTMTLYYPPGSVTNGITSIRFATIIQEMLLGRLGTVNRKIIPRPNLVVLKGTVMPAALAEVAFLTNKGDRNNLLAEPFRQKAAQALCDAVVKAYGELK